MGWKLVRARDARRRLPPRQRQEPGREDLPEPADVGDPERRRAARARRSLSRGREGAPRDGGRRAPPRARIRPANPEIGYITRYGPGLRENGGVYTHAATWAIAAAAKAKDAPLVEKLLVAIHPANKDPERYAAEPYVLPGNVDGPASPYHGRAGWTWYTGSAAWLHRVVAEWVLGVRPTWDGLLLDPCLPPSWDSARIVRPWRGSTLRISIRRAPADVCESARTRVLFDGTLVESGLITGQAPFSARDRRSKERGTPRQPGKAEPGRLHEVEVSCR